MTGGAGFIGSHTAKALALAGHEPIVFDNLRTGHRWAAKWGHFVHGDINDVHALVEVMRREHIDIVMHFAALAYVGESVRRPDLYWRTNVIGTLNLLDAMRIADVQRIIFSSSCATYGIPETMPIDECSPQNPINPYGRTKLTCENIISNYVSAFGFGSLYLRYFNVSGADAEGEIGEEHHPETHLIPLVLQAAARKIPCVSILGIDYPTADGTCIRDYIHVSDLAKAHVAGMSIIDPGQESALNLGSGRGFSVREVIDEARRVTGKEIAVKVEERRPGDPPVLMADASAACDRLHWAPVQSTLPAMIESTWAWMVEHRTRVNLRSLLE